MFYLFCLRSSKNVLTCILRRMCSTFAAKYGLETMVFKLMTTSIIWAHCGEISHSTTSYYEFRNRLFLLQEDVFLSFDLA